METFNVETKKIKPYERNAKKHSQTQIDNVAESIKQFGFVQPIVVDKNNVCIIGHCRLEASKKLGLEEVPCLRLENLSNEDVKKLRILDNKLNESEWDFDLLKDDIFDVDFSGFDVDFGFEFENEKSIDDIVEDEPPLPPAEPKSKLGDLYELGEHRLICGDCTDQEIVKKLMGGEMADMVFTDPPYGMNYQSNGRKEKFEIIKNDNVLLDFFEHIKGYNQGFVFVCTTWKVLKEWIELFEKYYKLTNMIIWNKGGGGIGDLYKTFATDYEIILVSNNEKEIQGKRIGSIWNLNEKEILQMKKEDLIKIVLDMKEYSSIWDIKKDDVNSYVHPTQKPVKLVAKALNHSTIQGNICLDVFGGSGSTLMACEQLKRRCYMAELDPHYVDVIIERWETFTGKKAEKIKE